MRILVVAPYPPIHDGIGAYAVQQVAALRAAGHHVEVLSPMPSAAHHHLELSSPRGPLALAKRMHRYDRVIVHFHVDMFYPRPLSRLRKVTVTGGLIVAFSRARSLDLMIHEIDYSWGRRWHMRTLVSAMLRIPTVLGVHTATEKTRLCKAFRLPDSAVTVVEHGANFVRRTTADPAAARRTLGIPEDAFVFLAIGFIQPHKGFDRALSAFAGLAGGGRRLYVVGSLRTGEPHHQEHLDELRQLAEQIPGAELRPGFVSDELFDRWIVAADVVLLPYRFIWSSGVLERCRLYDRPVIASDVGGLRDQRYGRLTLVRSDAELAAAMTQAAGGAHIEDRPSPSVQFSLPEDASQTDVMHAIRERAARHRAVARGSRRAAAPASELVPLLRLSPMAPLSVDARTPTKRWLKRIMHRLTKWETDPLIWQVNALRAATVEVAERLAERPADGPPADARDEPP